MGAKRSMERGPSPDALRLAAEWLDCYESSDEDDSQERMCRAVAKWLRDQADARDFRDACREAGVPVGTVRRMLGLVVQRGGDPT